MKKKEKDCISVSIPPSLRRAGITGYSDNIPEGGSLNVPVEIWMKHFGPEIREFLSKQKYGKRKK